MEQLPDFGGAVHLSPDGSCIAYFDPSGDLAVMDMRSRQKTTLLLSINLGVDTYIAGR